MTPASTATTKMLLNNQSPLVAGKGEGVPGVVRGLVHGRRLGETNHEKNEETQHDSSNPRQ